MFRKRNLARTLFLSILTAAFLLPNISPFARAEAVFRWHRVGEAFSWGMVYSSSLALDSKGTPYVAYQNYEFKATVAKFNGTSWVTVGVPGFSAGTANFLSVKLDRQDTPFVAFQDGANDDKATVMKFDGKAWVVVGYPGLSKGTAGEISLSINSTGTPYVAYADRSKEGRATVMKFNGSGWATVGGAGFSAGEVSFTSMAFNSVGSPYVAYCDNSNGHKATLMIYFCEKWVAVGTGGISDESAYFTSLAIDRNDIPYVAFEDCRNGERATVMRFFGTSWEQVGKPGFSSYSASYISLAIDKNGTPYIAYQDDYRISGKAVVMKFNGLDWAAVGSLPSDQGFCVSLAVDMNGLPYMACCNTIGYDQITVRKCLPEPVVYGVMPNSGPAQGGTTVLISGEGFASTTNVKFGTFDATHFSVINDNLVIAVVPTGMVPQNSEITVDVTVTTIGTSAMCFNDQYRLTNKPSNHPVPTVNSISPPNGTGAGGDILTITGTGFSRGGPLVKFGTTYGSILAFSDTSITVRSPAGSGQVDHCC